MTKLESHYLASFKPSEKSVQKRQYCTIFWFLVQYFYKWNYYLTENWYFGIKEKITDGWKNRLANLVIKMKIIPSSAEMSIEASKVVINSGIPVTSTSIYGTPKSGPSILSHKSSVSLYWSFFIKRFVKNSFSYCPVIEFVPVFESLY